MKLKCPNCNQVLEQGLKQFYCNNNHQFDRAKSGYVNLLQSQKENTKNHGDDRTMLLNRKSFLDKGFYLPLVIEMKRLIETLPHNTILDAGCGEGWYSEHIGGNILGIDISKHACDLSSRRNKSMTYAVASTYDLPLMDESVELAYSVFAPFSAPELERVLTEEGHFIQVYPLVDHLMGLKSAIYDSAYPNDVLDSELQGFTIVSEHEVHDIITLNDNETIQNLFTMTPYVHRTKNHELNRLQDLTELTTQIAFGIRIYKKIS